MKKLKACILGSTGIVGQQFVRMLAKHPLFEIAALTASEKSSGLSYPDVTDWVVSDSIPETAYDIPLCSTDIDNLRSLGVDLFFSALPGNISRGIETQVASMGYPVFTNASGHRMDSDVPILIPEINHEHLKMIHHQKYNGGYIIANSNCSTSGLVFGLKPLLPFDIRHVFVTTYQALSGAGRKGIYAMDIVGNVIPFINNEEEKIESETRIILGSLNDATVNPASFSVNASCARVPVMNGHLESVAVKLESNASVQDLECAFSSFIGPPQILGLPTAPSHPINITHRLDRPQPARDLASGSVGNGMSVTLGRLRKKDDWLNFFLLVDNTIRGAAGASILNAEYAHSQGVLYHREEATL